MDPRDDILNNAINKENVFIVDCRNPGNLYGFYKVMSRAHRTIFSGHPQGLRSKGPRLRVRKLKTYISNYR